MFKLSYGLFVVTAHEGEKDNGCITNTVQQVTVTPNRITVAVNKSNYTCGMIERTGRFNVSILSEAATFDIFKHWGFQSGATVDKALGITFSRAANGVIYITEGVNAVLCAKPSTWALTCCLLPTSTMRLCSTKHHRQPMLSITRTSSRHRRLPRKKDGCAPSADISTRATLCLPTLSARFASILPATSSHCKQRCRAHGAWQI